MSHARMKDETELAPSPLIASIVEIPLESLEAAPPALLRDVIRASGTLESIDDPTGPPLADKVLASGGTRIFRDQATCPFRAFAHVRLASEPLEAPRPGLTFSPAVVVPRQLIAPHVDTISASRGSDSYVPRGARSGERRNSLPGLAVA